MPRTVKTTKCVGQDVEKPKSSEYPKVYVYTACAMNARQQYVPEPLTMLGLESYVGC